MTPKTPKRPELVTVTKSDGSTHLAIRHKKSNANPISRSTSSSRSVLTQQPELKIDETAQTAVDYLVKHYGDESISPTLHFWDKLGREFWDEVAPNASPDEQEQIGVVVKRIAQTEKL